MSSSLSAGEEFMLEDSSSLDDNSYLEDLLVDDNVEHTMVIIIVKNLHNRLQMKMQRGFVIGYLCIPQNRALGHESLIQDYFSKVPTTYPPSLFCRRFRMRQKLFVKIVRACEANCLYFTSQRNAVDTLGYSAFQKISAAMRVIAYGIPIDYIDVYLRIGEDTTIQSAQMCLQSQ
jgi:hypothetical protein